MVPFSWLSALGNGGTQEMQRKDFDNVAQDSIYFQNPESLTQLKSQKANVPRNDHVLQLPYFFPYL